MKKNLKVLMIVGLTFGLGCSTAVVRVMPGENGENRVTARDTEKDRAEEAATDGAKKYCEERNKEAVFLTESSQYTGKMDEETRTTVKNASKAAWMLGSVGSPIQSAGTVGTVMTSDRDYKAEATFKCR